MTSDYRIKSRLKSEEALTPWRRKIHDLRRLVAGDYSSVDETADPQEDPSAISDDSWKVSAGYTDILVRDFETGTSNKMLQALKTLVLQSAFRFPDIEFKDAHPLEAAVNALYLAKRLGPRPYGCDAVPQMRRALWHYVVDGIGWVWCGVRDGKPIVTCVDPFHVSWDMSVDLITDIRWVSVRCRDSLAYWVDLFGEAPFEDLLGDDEQAKERALESVIELIWYYDVDGARGTHAVYRCTGDGPDGEPIELSDNPHTMEVDGIEVPFLPLEPLFFLALPSVRQPIGIAELMLPSQVALRKGDVYMNAVLDRGAPWYDMEADTYSEEERAKLEEGTAGEIIERKARKPPVTVHEPMEIPQTVFARAQHHEQELFASSGANPYSAGGKVEGIQYASEVNAIQSNASLVAATIASDNADCWRRVSTKSLANGAKYDMMPLTLSLDGDELRFGPQNPIGEYLRVDAYPIVAEDSGAFSPRDKRIQDAANLLNAAKSVAVEFPNSMKLAYEKFLQASGVRDTAAHLEPPVLPPGVVPPGAASEGGLDPAAQANATTAV